MFRRSERGIGRVREGRGREKDFDFFQPLFSFDFILSPPIPFSTMIKPTGMRRGGRFDINCWSGMAWKSGLGGEEVKWMKNDQKKNPNNENI